MKERAGADTGPAGAGVAPIARPCEAGVAP